MRSYPYTTFLLGTLAVSTLLVSYACSPAKQVPTKSLYGSAFTPGDRSFERAVVIGPSTAATIAAMGLAEKVVGVSDYCSDQAFANLPRVGGQQDPSLERIVVLKPDLVIIQGESLRLRDWCEQNNIAFRRFLTDSWDEWLDEVLQLGDLFAAPGAAERVRGEAETRLQRARSVQEHSPSVLLVVGRRPHQASGLVVAGAASFLSELLEIAGGRNAVADNPRDYFDLNEEAVLLLNPDIILEFIPPDQDTFEIWEAAFPSLRAVQSKQVFAINKAWAVQPGPRMPDTAMLFSKLITAFPANN